jgi:hypothetical protein
MDNKEISNIIEKLMIKYEKMSRFSPNDLYFEGVQDGLNHAFKLVNGIQDDFLKDIK